MNETLRHALLRAGLTEEAVATRLGVDPKTVRRWLEGRLPYPRLRWQLAFLLATDESELWPGLVTTGGVAGRLPEIVGVYPNVTSVPAELFRRLIGSADDDIGILVDSVTCLARDASMIPLLRSRADHGAHVRVALRDPGQIRELQDSSRLAEDAAIASRAGRELKRLVAALDSTSSEIRLYRLIPYNSILIADLDVLVSQRLQGAPSDRSPVLHLQGEPSGELIAGYRASFEDVWASSREHRIG